MTAPGAWMGMEVASVAGVAWAVERSERLTRAFFRRAELRAYRDGTEAAHGLAARLAAKRALRRALADDPRELPPLRDIEVRQEAGRAPTVMLHGAARRRWRARGFGACGVSLSHDDRLALAVVVVYAARPAAPSRGGHRPLGSSVSVGVC